MGVFDKLFGGHHSGGGSHHGGGGHHGYGQASQNVGGNSGIVCEKCRTINVPTARFCQQCSNLLAPTKCPQCGAVPQPNAKFCEQCGKRIA